MFENLTQSYTGGDATLEIVIMLAVAFVLGFLLRHIFCTPADRHRDPDPSPVSKTSAVARVADIPSSVGEAGVDAPTAAAEEEAMAPREPPPDEDGSDGESASTETLGKSSETPSVTQAGKREPDDLRRVDGIGPKIAELLKADGISSFEALAKADVERLKRILDGGGPRFRMHDPSSWPEQARLLAEGREDELRTFLKARRG